MQRLFRVTPPLCQESEMRGVHTNSSPLDLFVASVSSRHQEQKFWTRHSKLGHFVVTSICPCLVDAEGSGVKKACLNAEFARDIFRGEAHGDVIAWITEESVLIPRPERMVLAPLQNFEHFRPAPKR